ncbi:hypothetical protein CR513_11175, partial [Mucuna pruriens]
MSPTMENRFTIVHMRHEVNLKPLSLREGGMTLREEWIGDTKSSWDESSFISETSLSKSNFSPYDSDLLMKVYSIIIHCGGCVNVASLRIVEKLNLLALVHPKPYKLQWLNSKGEMTITNQVSLAFTLGKYSDEVLCDVVPIEATHILLERS